MNFYFMLQLVTTQDLGPGNQTLNKIDGIQNVTGDVDECWEEFPYDSLFLDCVCVQCTYTQSAPCNFP